MRIAYAFASIALVLGACGDNIKPGSSVDAADPDASVDAIPLDANCPARAQGLVGGPCTMDSQCDSATGAGDGICLTASLGGIGWPAIGYCVTDYDGCTMDSECGSGNVCVTINDPDGAFRACMPACGTGECACANGQACSNNLSGSAMDKMACIPANPASVDGAPCTGFGECDINSICRNDPAEFPGGQCVQIGCTVGNDATCTSGGDGHCTMPGFVSVGTGCVDRCNVDADCRVAEGYKCFDAGGATGKYCRHPQTGDVCTTDTDCGDANVWNCRTGAGFPGGYCTPQAACNPVTGGGCAAGSSVCYDPTGGDASDAYCVDRCSGAGQGTCRASYTCTQVPNPGGGTIGGCL